MNRFFKYILSVSFLIFLSIEINAQDIDTDKGNFNLYVSGYKFDNKTTTHLGFSVNYSGKMWKNEKWDIGSFHDLGLSFGLGDVWGKYLITIYEELGALAIYEINTDNEIGFGLSPSVLYGSAQAGHFGYGINFKYRYKKFRFDNLFSPSYGKGWSFPINQSIVYYYLSDKILLGFKTIMFTDTNQDKSLTDFSLVFHFVW